MVSRKRIVHPDAYNVAGKVWTAKRGVILTSSGQVEEVVFQTRPGFLPPAPAVTDGYSIPREKLTGEQILLLPEGAPSYEFAVAVLKQVVKLEELT